MKKFKIFIVFTLIALFSFGQNPKREFKSVTKHKSYVEVKTNAPLIYYDSFSIPNGQYNKIMNSHRVYWISVPLQTKEDQFAGCIFEMDPKVAQLHNITFHTGNTIIALKRQQEGMKIIHKIEDKALLNHLKSLSTSYM